MAKTSTPTRRSRALARAAAGPMALKEPARARPPDVAQDPDEVGASGTQNFGGYITGEEYNPVLAPPAGFAQYEQMRKSDPQVRASLWIVKHPLLSGKWTVQAPKDPTPQDQEVADFCQKALFERGAMVDGWEFVLRHALLMLDFGVSPLEKVWTLNPEQRIVVHRLAPRLPKTIERFDLDEKDRLQAVVQLVVKQRTFKHIAIETDRLALFIHDREGDNYWGQSILRSAYKPWFYKCEAEKAEAVRVYRYGVGVPMASKAKDAGSDPNEDARVESILKGIVSHERSFIRTNDSWTWKILIPEGGVGGAANTQLWIDYNNRMIMRNILADFLGETPDGLNSGRTRTLADVFASALYSAAEHICQVIDLAVLRPLCDYNFDMTERRYPSLVANDVTDLDVKLMADVLVRLGAAKFLSPDDGIEGLLRELLGLPPLSEDMKGKSRERVPPPFAPPADPHNPSDKTDPPAPAKKQDPKDPQPVVDDATKTATRAPRPTITLAKPYELYGRRYARELSAFELRVFSFGEVPDTLDDETEKLTFALGDIRRQQLATLSEAIAKKDARATTGEFTDLRPSEFAIAMKTDVERAIKDALMRVFEFGSHQVRLELSRQGKTIELRAPLFDGAIALAGAGKNKKTAKSALTSSAKVATESETDAWFNRTLETAMRVRRTGVQGDDLANAIQQSLLPEVESGVRALAKGEINEAFAIGRAAEATKHQDEIAEVEYSCLLDAYSCKNCEALDGLTFPFESEMYFKTMPPYSDCEGNKGRPDACRCVHLFHLA